MRFKKIYIEITNNCNKNCSFCSLNIKKKNEMSPTSFDYVINQIKPYTNYVYLHVKGEPLIHSHFDDIINICNNNSIKVNITTNGSLMRKRYNSLLNTCIRQINISFQSYEDDIDMQEILDIFKVVNDLLNNNKELNVVFRFWAIKDKKLTSNNKRIIEFISNYYELPTLFELINDKNNIKIKDRLYINLDEEFEWPNLSNNFTSFYGKCLGTCSHIGILSDGTVIPCCLDANGIINFGNIFEKNLETILNSDRFTEMNIKIHQNKFSEKLCQHCSFKNRFNSKK